MTIQQAFENFILSRKLADLSSKSISAYMQFVRPFLLYIGMEKHIDLITQTDISKYIGTIIDKPLSRSSKATYIRHLKIFLRWCEMNIEQNIRLKK